MARRVAEDLVTDHVQGGGDPGPDLARTHQVAPGDRRGRQAEGRATRPARDQAGVEQPTQIDHVGLLGAEVGRAGQSVAGSRPQGRLDQQADDLDVTVRGEDDRVGVDPLVVEPQPVHAGQGVGDLPDHPGRLQPRQRAVAEQHLQRPADRVLADDVRAELGILAVNRVEDAQEAGVDGQRGPPGGLQDVRRLGVEGGEQVDHHRAGQHEIEGPPGDRAGGLGEQLLHPVPVAEHRAGAGHDPGQGAGGGVGVRLSAPSTHVRRAATRPRDEVWPGPRRARRSDRVRRAGRTPGPTSCSRRQR